MASGGVLAATCKLLARKYGRNSRLSQKRGWKHAILAAAAYEEEGPVAVARRSREAFVLEILEGKSCDPVMAALHIAAEDDAIKHAILTVSSSPVPLPVETYRDRVEKLARDAIIHMKDCTCSLEQALDSFLLDQCRFTVPVSKRSGGWIQGHAPSQHVEARQDPRELYLSSVLTTRRGCPEAIEILRRGVLDYISRHEAALCDKLRQNQVSEIPESNQSWYKKSNIHLLEGMLRRLQRAFWPFPWEGELSRDGGGFAQACMAALGEGDAMNASQQIAARTATHRLKRGIWTSSNGGDPRRALAATERLLILSGGHGGSSGLFRRDYGVLLAHMGLFTEALQHLHSFLDDADIQIAGEDECDGNDDTLGTPLWHGESKAERYLCEKLVNELSAAQSMDEHNSLDEACEFHHSDPKLPSLKGWLVGTIMRQSNDSLPW